MAVIRQRRPSALCCVYSVSAHDIRAGETNLSTMRRLWPWYQISWSETHQAADTPLFLPGKKMKPSLTNTSRQNYKTLSLQQKSLSSFQGFLFSVCFCLCDMQTSYYCCCIMRSADWTFILCIQRFGGVTFCLFQKNKNKELYYKAISAGLHIRVSFTHLINCLSNLHTCRLYCCGHKDVQCRRLRNFETFNINNLINKTLTELSMSSTAGVYRPRLINCSSVLRLDDGFTTFTAKLSFTPLFDGVNQQWSVLDNALSNTLQGEALGPLQKAPWASHPQRALHH